MGRQQYRVLPVVTEVVFIVKKDWRATEAEVEKSDFAGLEGATATGVFLIKLGRSIGQTADVELVQMAIGPAERRLEHFMQLGKIEIRGQFKRTADHRVDFQDVDVGTNHKGVRIEHGR